jgi:hypothetical protein
MVAIVTIPGSQDHFFGAWHQVAVTIDAAALRVIIKVQFDDEFLLRSDRLGLFGSRVSVRIE